MTKVSSDCRKQGLPATRSCSPVLNMGTPSVSQLQHDGDSGGSNTASPLYLPWQTISVLASETGQAVRQTFSDSGICTSGHVQQGLQYHVSPSERSEHLPQL